VRRHEEEVRNNICRAWTRATRLINNAPIREARLVLPRSCGERIDWPMIKRILRSREVGAAVAA